MRGASRQLRVLRIPRLVNWSGLPGVIRNHHELIGLGDRTFRQPPWKDTPSGYGSRLESGMGLCAWSSSLHPSAVVTLGRARTMCEGYCFCVRDRGKVFIWGMSLTQ